ncbi:ANTAR domain-containing protein [Streptomyces sp. NPDC059850]|uniref:ANTAR domain-containing protein n=1 Tax=Streptomyces sp. NPDC059850 TaxID=3346970 RepID=UPI003646DD80
MSGHERRLAALAATVERLRGELTTAQQAADARALIGIATGILVERGHGGPTGAARHLEELAEAAGLPLLELAADVVDGAAGDTVARALSGAVRGPGGGHPSPPDVLRVRAAEASSLTGDPQTVVDTLIEQVLAPLGVSAVALWAVVSGGALALAGHAGFPPGEAERWRFVPPGLGVPAPSAP